MSLPNSFSLKCEGVFDPGEVFCTQRVEGWTSTSVIACTREQEKKTYPADTPKGKKVEIEVVLKKQ